MPRPVISLVSFFNSGNLGDLLIADELVRRCEKFGAVRPVSFSGAPLSHRSPEAYRQELPSASSHRPTGPLVSRAMASTLALHLYRRNWKRKGIQGQVEKVFSESDLVVIGGGNMIFDLDRWTHSAENFRYFARLARAVGVPVVGMALGIGPFATESQHRAAARALDLCEKVTFRDAHSQELYQRWGNLPSQISVDPVLLMPAQLPPRHTATGVIALNVPDPRFLVGSNQHSRERTTDSVVELASLMLDRGLKVRLFSTDDADLGHLRILHERIARPNCSIETLTGMSSLLELYRDSDVVVAGRMHALIVAATQNRPVVGLAWQQKVHSFFETIHRPDQKFDVQDIPTNEVLELIGAMQASPDRHAVTPESVPELRARARLDEQVLADALAQRPEPQDA